MKLEAPLYEAGAIDILEIAARARAMRAAAVADLLTRSWAWLAVQFSPDRARRRRQEEYLAQANFLPISGPDWVRSSTSIGRAAAARTDISRGPSTSPISSTGSVSSGVKGG